MGKRDTVQIDEVAKLLVRVRKGSSDAFAKLFKMYKPLLESEVARYISSFGDADIDDLRQGALVALYHAALSYRSDNGVTFGLYAKICIVNGIADTLRYLGKKAADVSMDTLTDDDFWGGDENPQDLMLDKEAFANSLKKICKVLSPLEYRIFLLYLGGYSYAEIAERAGKSEKSVDNALRRVKEKLKRIF
ncbi:MAG: sigma-70 family RNA polymerase sigma factor [Ruminococcaceae bacterium]|nr:sigma-70 family RNA polymerase sigma factor [Oscillospiraceae bacterium]